MTGKDRHGQASDGVGLPWRVAMKGHGPGELFLSPAAPPPPPRDQPEKSEIREQCPAAQDAAVSQGEPPQMNLWNSLRLANGSLEIAGIVLTERHIVQRPV